jgi:ketosteroid isomerase-like protein
MATKAQAAEFVERFTDAWQRHSAEPLNALLTDDVVLIQPLMPRLSGKAAARREFERLFRLIPDLHADVHGWASDNDVVFVDFTLRGTFGGAEISWPVVDRIRLRDGLVAERVSYFDAVPLLVQAIKRPSGWRRLASAGLRLRLR